MAQLPPKIPNMTQNWPDFSPHQKMGTFLQPPQTTACTTANNQSPSWVDEFLDFSSVRRGSHRRSASDSIAFLEAPHNNMVTRHIGGNNGNNNGDHDDGDDDDRFDGFDEQLFISMFNHHEISPLAAAVGPTLSSSDHSAPSDHNSINEEKRHQQQQQQQPKNESDEEQSSCKSEAQATMQEATAAAAAEANTTSDDRIFDPKRVKRILANRQSAQRSRVRKLQYISELERSVNSLQAEVSVLSPRVAFLDHQRLLLNVDNSAIKQRIAALAQDKIFKDAHQEALKREIERLRQVYHQQSVKKTENKPPSSPPSCDTNGSTEKEAELLISV